jgi:hypothetical protein
MRPRCPNCGSRDYYITRARCGDKIKESWYCSACFFEKKVEDQKDTEPATTETVVVPPNPEAET